MSSNRDTPVIDRGLIRTAFPDSRTMGIFKQVACQWGVFDWVPRPAIDASLGNRYFTHIIWARNMYS